MKGIFKKDNVYVYVNNKEKRDDIQEEDMNALVYSPDSEYGKEYVCLYGGRVYLGYNDYSSLKLSVDGISIRQIQHSDNYWFTLSESLDMKKVTAFLNQMENLGIDTFLDNYKKQLVNFKKEMEEKVGKMEQEQSIHYEDYIAKRITSLRNALTHLACIIFCLLINMNAGLDNQTYTDAYNEIINLYF